MYWNFWFLLLNLDLNPIFNPVLDGGQKNPTFKVKDLIGVIIFILVR